MLKQNRKLFTVVAALLFGAVGFGACSSASTNTVSTGNTNSGGVSNASANKQMNAAPTNANAPTANSTAEVRSPLKSEETASADTSKGEKIGVPECDEYIAKYEACVSGKVPEAQRAAFNSQIGTMRTGWKNAASNPQAKTALAGGCKQALTTAKQSMSQFSCDW